MAKRKKHDIRVFKSVLSKDQAIEKVLENKDKAFSIVHNVKSFFSKEAGIKVNRTEKHYHPFWHIAAENYQEYKRNTPYSFTVKPEVRAVKIHGKTVDIQNLTCEVVGEDHCVEHYEKEKIADATESNEKEKSLTKYLEFESRPIKETEDLMGRGKVVIPATIRASYLVKELFKELIKPIHADKIIEDRVQVTKLVLYFRPAYSIELVNEATGKTGVLEIDSLTGDVRKGKFFDRELKELIGENVLFDLGAEIASMVIPGAAMGAAIGKEIKRRHGRKKQLKIAEKHKKAFAKKKKK